MEKNDQITGTNKVTEPDATWTREEVADWARKVLKFSEKSAKILIEAEVSGKSLLAYQKVEDLFGDFEEELKQKQISKSALQTLWAEIEKLKKSRLPKEPEQQKNAEKSPDSKVRILHGLYNTAPPEEVQRALNVLQAIMDKPKVEHRDNRFTFFVPMGTLWLSTWQGLSHPPFYNHQTAIFSLLNDCYNNYTGACSKPMHTIAVTSPGFGKTRLALEWAIRVFHLPNVMVSFLLGKQNVEEIELEWIDLTKVERKQLFTQKYNFEHSKLQDIEKRLEFLAQLHKTLIQVRVISTSAAQYNTSFTPAVICERMLTRAIGDQLSTVTIKSQSINVDETTAEDWIAAVNAGSRLTSLWKFYQVGKDQIPYKPVFKDVKLSDRPITLLNIDECQSFTDIKQQDRNLAYFVYKEFIEKTDCTLLLMVGLKSGPLHELQDPSIAYLRVNLPLDPLLKLDYLDDLCSSVLGKHYLQNSKPASSVLPADSRKIINSLWIKTFGIPRAIEFLFTAMHRYRQELQSGSISHSQSTEILASLSAQITCYFYPNMMELDVGTDYYKIDPQEWQKIIVAASLCLEKDPTTIILTTEGKKLSYADLEAAGILLPFNFTKSETPTSITTRSYTMPFTLNLFETYKIDLLSSMHPDSFPITLLHIIGTSTMSTDMIEQENDLEYATAASLWARYRLVANPGQFVQLSSIISWADPQYYISLSGVVQGKEVTQDHSLNDFEKNPAIYINKQKVSFADVMVPLFTKKDDRYSVTKVLCIQCQNVAVNHLKIKPWSLWKEISNFGLNSQPHLIWMLMSPNTITENLSSHIQDTDTAKSLEELEKEGRIIISNGDGWLSPLFLFATRSREVENDENIEITEPKQKKKQNKQQKRKVKEIITEEDKSEEPANKKKKK